MGVPGVALLHGPKQLAVGDGAVLPELLLPPAAGPQHRVPVGLVVVLSALLGVALEGDGEEDVAARYADELRDDLVGLLGVDVLEDIGAEDEVERVVLVGEVGEDAGLHPALLEHVGALLLEDRARQLDAVGVLAVLAHQADESTVTCACIEEGVDLNL